MLYEVLIVNHEHEQKYQSNLRKKKSNGELNLAHGIQRTLASHP